MVASVSLVGRRRSSTACQELGSKASVSVISPGSTKNVPGYGNSSNYYTKLAMASAFPHQRDYKIATMENQMAQMRAVIDQLRAQVQQQIQATMLPPLAAVPQAQAHAATVDWTTQAPPAPSPA